MKINDIIASKEALIKLNNIKFTDFNISYKIYKTIKTVNEILDTVQEEQNKIIAKYVAKEESGKLKIENNQYQFNSDDDKMRFINELTSLKNSEVEVNKIDIPVQSIQYANALSSSDLMTLDIFINWVE